MKLHRRLREQFRIYERNGFKVESVDQREGSHFRVKFIGIERPFFMTLSATDPRSYRNNLAQLRREAKGESK